jgi:hypothetical protein
VPGPEVHLRLTARWAQDEGFSSDEAERIGLEDLGVDARWPGRSKPWRHFNPTATLLFAPLYLNRALKLARTGDPATRPEALDWLGRSLHCKQDGIGHGRFGLSHIRWDLGWLKRHPDVWSTMPPEMRERMERETRERLRRFLEVGPAPSR